MLIIAINCYLGILDTINEEKDEIKRSLILNIFEKNYDKGGRSFKLKDDRTSINKSTQEGFKSLLSPSQQSHNSIFLHKLSTNKNKNKV